MDMDTELLKLQQESTLEQSVVEKLIGQLQLQIMQQQKYIELLEAHIRELKAEKTNE